MVKLKLVPVPSAIVSIMAVATAEFLLEGLSVALLKLKLVPIHQMIETIGLGPVDPGAVATAG